MDDIVIRNGSWTARDFELMADFYGIDADELLERVLSEGDFEGNYDDYVAQCWTTMESVAAKMAGGEWKGFDFIEASALHDHKKAAADAARYLPALDGETAGALRADGTALVDELGNRYELALVAEGWEFFACPSLPDGKRVLQGELSFFGLTPEQETVASEHEGPAFDDLVTGLSKAGNPPKLRIHSVGHVAAAEYRDLLEDFATFGLRPEFISPSAIAEAQQILAADPYLMHLHDANRPDSLDVDGGPTSSVSPAVLPAPTAEALKGYPMTRLLEEAAAASAALGADPDEAALARYGRAMDELDRREAPDAAPSKDIADYLSRALDAYRSMSGWQGLDAEGALECFVADLTAGRIPVAEPARDHLEIETEAGTLVASTALSYEDSRSIEISLEKPDGTSGQVAMVEYVTDGLAMEGEPPLRTFCWDGREAEYAACVEVDPHGEAMTYVGYEHGAPAVRPKEAPSPGAIADAARASAVRGGADLPADRRGPVR